MNQKSVQYLYLKRQLKHLKWMQWTLWPLALIAHLLLLFWILYVLGGAKSMDLITVTWHFTGLSLSGAGLIFVMAKLTKWLHLRELWLKKQLS